MAVPARINDDEEEEEDEGLFEEGETLRIALGQNSTSMCLFIQFLLIFVVN